MKQLVIILTLLSSLSCGVSSFDIDPTKHYTPAEVTAGGACDKIQPWENKTISIVGRIDQNYLSETENGGKFWLKDEKSSGFIEVYVRGASTQEVGAIYQLVKNSSKVTVTGKAVAATMPTQLTCRKSLYVEIDQASDIKP